MARLPIVTIFALLTFATDANGQSRLGFRKSEATKPSLQARREPATGQRLAAKPSSGSHLVVVHRQPQIPREPRPLRPPIGIGLALRGNGEIRVEQRVMSHETAVRPPGDEPLLAASGQRSIPHSRKATSASTGVEKSSFETPLRIAEAGLAYEPVVEADAEPVPLSHEIAMENAMENAMQHATGFHEVYPAINYLPARFPYARKPCLNFPFATDLWAGYCYDRMSRHHWTAHKLGLFHCACASCHGCGACCRGGCCACGVHGNRPADPPREGTQGLEMANPSNNPKMDTSKPAGSQPIRVYPRAPRNVPPPPHLLRPRR